MRMEGRNMLGSYLHACAETAKDERIELHELSPMQTSDRTMLLQELPVTVGCTRCYWQLSLPENIYDLTVRMRYDRLPKRVLSYRDADCRPCRHLP